MSEFGRPQEMIERLFVSVLRRSTDLADLEIVPASDREARVGPLHCYVLCETATPITSTGPLYRAPVSVVVVSNMDDTANDERKEWADKVRTALQDTTPLTEEYGALLGWTILTHAENSEDQQTGDVFDIICGAQLGTT